MVISSPPRVAGLFVATRSLALLDHFRTPYAVDDRRPSDTVEQLRPVAGGPALLWPRHHADAPMAGATLRARDGRIVRLFAHLVPDCDVGSILPNRGLGWSPDGLLAGDDGGPLASVWRHDDGSIFLPFDPDEVIVNFLSERYAAVMQGATSRLGKRALMHSYYRVRPALPRAFQIWLRRRFAAIQAGARFPGWPIETSLHDFFDFMFELLSRIADRPIPRIAPWPGDHSWALVLTHDVEHREGWCAMDPVLELERAHGLRSSWNLVPRRYEVELDRVRQLVSDGFEVGVHGLYHDGRDLESLATLRRRLPGMRDAAEQWGAVGFRSPATHRGWDLMPQLGFDYDSSYPDTDPYEPQAGGCCTWLPFFNQGTVELPLTLPQDHTLFVILGHTDEAAWVEKAMLLRDRGGMALIDTHPDYLVDDRIMHAYGGFLKHFATDDSAWKALPRDVNAWWRRRAASGLEAEGDGWRIIGPGAENGRIELFTGRSAD